MTAPRRLELHPGAVDEAAAAREWYAARSVTTAARFMAELDRAVERILAAPEQWSRYLHGTRQYLLRRFPYLVVYRESNDVLQIVAIAHVKRRPGYWKDRTRS